MSRWKDAFATQAVSGLDIAGGALRWCSQWLLLIALAPFALVGWLASKEEDSCR